MIDKIYTPYTRVLCRETDYRVYAVPTVVGFVIAVAYLHSANPEHDMIEFQAVIDGQLYSRVLYGKAYSQAYCTRLARQWAWELKESAE